MATHTVHLKSKNEVADGTMAFHFEKPAGFEFRPGQALDVILVGPGVDAGSADGRHAFSIVSAPHEDEIVVTTRMRDSTFKKALGSLPIGGTVQVDGLFGSLTMHKKVERAGVMVAGGIGVTPFMSILRHAAEQHSVQPLVLLYSNRRPEDTAFLAELQSLEKKNPHFKLVATMTDMDKSGEPWSGATGFIDAAFIQQAVKGLPSPVFYVSGPPAMVEAMRHTLEQAGIDEDDVRSEEFYGY